MSQSVLDGDADEAEKLANSALEQGAPPLDCVEKGFVKGIEEVGRMFEKGEMFLPELVAAADAMKGALDILKPALENSAVGRKSFGRVVIGTVKGDIHDIGKSIVGSLLTASGFDVLDLGVDVDTNLFVAKAKEFGANMVGLSALLTTTMPAQREVVRLLKEAGLRDKVKVLVGGAPVTERWAGEIGADGYAEDAIRAVAAAKKLLGVA
ncbi:MAG: corrinoid protein [Firmicutes bacterium]|nr:corrinoid protein [Bacillota bacterium]